MGDNNDAFQHSIRLVSLLEWVSENAKVQVPALLLKRPTIPLTMAEAFYNKRMWISAADSPPQGPTCLLSDLPSGILAHAANFLAPPSRALFAVALDESSAASSNERSSAIAGNQWDVLDFGLIEKVLAAKLTDDHIEKVLLCIDAVNKVNRLKLTNCVNITGVGLEPLRGSLMIEQIDLSLARKHQSPIFYSEPPISRDHVLPILDSIIEREGFALKYFQFPKAWRNEGQLAYTESEFHAFIVRCNQMWRNRGAISCLECNRSLPETEYEWIEPEMCRFYGTQNHTCYDCLRHYCYDCETEEMKRPMKKCSKCERDYCVDCLTMQLRRSCAGYYCIDCCEDECQRCNEKICSGCIQQCTCETCDKVLCAECNDIEGEEDVRYCDECFGRSCEDCRVRQFREWQEGCAECIRRIAKRLHEELEQLKLENEELKHENKELKLENKELRSKN
jgi:hypothetical protein